VYLRASISPFALWTEVDAVVICILLNLLLLLSITAALIPFNILRVVERVRRVSQKSRVSRLPRVRTLILAYVSIVLQ
jgi:hypothetical protein